MLVDFNSKIASLYQNSNWIISSLNFVLQVIVHEPGTTADPINQGFILAPGVSALASISKKRVKVKVHNLN